MSIVVHETFEPGWESSWEGKAHNAYKSGDGLRILFREGEHYGTSLHKEIVPTRHVKVSYMVRVASNWDSNSTGKTVGFADLRWKNSQGQSYGHGNRRPNPDGFSFRTWFGKTVNGKVPVGMYVYHLGQKSAWGDSIAIGEITAGNAHVLFECETNFDDGYIQARIGDGPWVKHNIVATDKTAVTWAWLDGYYGGAATAPFNMAWDIDDYKLENLGVNIDKVDWAAVTAIIEAKEATETQTAETQQLSTADRLKEIAEQLTQLALSVE
jgi:hypothetical protein